MLTGRTAFARDTISDTIAAILERDPDWGELPLSVPSNVSPLLHRCLEKDPKQRLRDIGDIGLVLDGEPSRAITRTTWLWPAAVLFVLLVVREQSHRCGPAQRADEQPVGVVEKVLTVGQKCRKSPAEEADVTALTDLPTTTVIVGGPPYQGFSSAGNAPGPPRSTRSTGLPFA